MPDAMKAQGWVTNPATDSRIGRMVGEGLAILAEQSNLPGTVLVALGTNDWTASVTEAAEWIAQTRDIIGPDRDLIWVNVQMEGDRFSTFPQVNEGLRGGARADRAAQRSAGALGRTLIADWADYSADFHIKHSHDGVHYKASAFRKRMDFYAGVLAGVAPFNQYLLKR